MTKQKDDMSVPSIPSKFLVHLHRTTCRSQALVKDSEQEKGDTFGLANTRGDPDER